MKRIPTALLAARSTAINTAITVTLAILSSGALAAPATFRNPLNSGPDPFLAHYKGNYLLATTQGKAVRIWKSPTLGGLKDAPAVTVWSDNTPSRCCNIWAAEFHRLDGPNGARWYLYYTADDNTDSHHRMYVLESAGDDPMGPYAFKGQIATDPKNEFYAIDGSILKKGNGELYFLWAGYPGHRLFISKMSNPWTTTGNRTLIPADGFGCEEVREGPIALRRNGKIFLTYSACDTGKPDYKLGMVVADEGDDVLKASNWVQHPSPIFERSNANGVYGPGHHSFFMSPDGKEDWILYHGKASSAYSYGGRDTRAQRFSWKPDGNPDFGIPLPLSADVTVPSGDGSMGVGVLRADGNRIGAARAGRAALGLWVGMGTPRLVFDAMGRLRFSDGRGGKNNAPAVWGFAEQSKDVPRSE
jgi:GH43 family beta-xylosidase